MTNKLNGEPLNIELPELAQAAFVEIQETGDVKMAYALIVSWFLRENFSVDQYRNKVEEDILKLLNIYKSLPEDISILHPENRKRAEAIKRTIKNIEDFFIEYNKDCTETDKKLNMHDLFVFFGINDLDKLSGFVEPSRKERQLMVKRKFVECGEDYMRKLLKNNFEATLLYSEGYRYDEIAAKLEKSELSIRQSLSRSFNQLRISNRQLFLNTLNK